MTKIKNIIPTKFKDIKLFELASYNDDRGSFREVFNKEVESLIGEKINFIQDNESRSKRGVLRGLHFQKPPSEQSKLIRVSHGEVQDVVVDIRPKSETYGQWESFILSSDNNRSLFVPRGFAHGFLVLSQEAVVNYKVDNYYESNLDSGIVYNDAILNIEWKLSHEDIIVSHKDKELPGFQK